MEAAAERCGQNSGLTSLKMRTSPEESIEDMHGWVRAAQWLSQTGPAEVGLIFHFVKTRGGESAPGVPQVRGSGSTADPTANSSGYRHGDFFARQRRAATTLARLLHRLPLSLLFIRGVDICSDEVAVPCWVLKPPRRSHTARCDHRGTPCLRSAESHNPFPCARRFTRVRTIPTCSPGCGISMRPARFSRFGKGTESGMGLLSASIRPPGHPMSEEWHSRWKTASLISRGNGRGGRAAESVPMPLGWRISVERCPASPTNGFATRWMRWTSSHSPTTSPIPTSWRGLDSLTASGNPYSDARSEVPCCVST